MINISHKKLHGKPPVKKSLRSKDVNLKQSELAMENVSYEKERDNSNPAMKMEKEDYNQNIIESTTCSFEQLCDMISKLEHLEDNIASNVGDIGSEMPEIDLQLEPEKDNSKEKCETNESTYDDIMSFLTKLEDGSLDSTKVNVPEVDAVILQEIFSSKRLPCVNYDSIVATEVTNRIPRVFEEDLAMARLQLEERNATITILKDQLKSERKLVCEKLDAQSKSNASKLLAQKEKYNAIVKRHQKFVEQLISEKTDLTEKCNSLMQRVKEMEIKVQRDLKCAAERHCVELQRAKEHYAAAERIKREWWIESRTTKIKEMTVKGLEPELRNMMEQHAEEMLGLRNAHMKELQDAELRIIRRSNQQLEQLRLELTDSHERMLTNEKNILWARYKEKLEEQERQFKAQEVKFAEELQRDREKFSKKQDKHDAEREAALQRIQLQCQQEIEALRQQHTNEKKALQQSLKAEWEAWLADYKRQQNLKLQNTESDIIDKCHKERDRQIELAIERLEKDCRDTKLTLQRNFDNKFRLLREKFEMDLQTAIDNEKLYKNKLAQTENKLSQTEVQLQMVEKKLQEYRSDWKNINEAVKRTTMEKENAKKLARQEIEVEKRELEEKIASLYQEISRNNANRDASMAQLHSRIKLIMTQKVLTIKNLTKQLDDVKSKCQHLEKLVDQQRREYILKCL